MGVLPGLVMLDLGVGSCLVGDSGEVFGVVSEAARGAATPNANFSFAQSPN